MTSDSHVIQLVHWIRRQAHQFDARGVVFRVATNLQSAVVGALAKQALDENVLGLILPCHSSIQAIEAAKQLAENLGVDHRVVDLSSSYDAFISSLGSPIQSMDTGLVARLRMAALYYFAERHKHLVLSTLPRTLWEVGLFSKHGDNAADMHPIIHLSTRELQVLGRELNLPPSVTHLSSPVDSFQIEMLEQNLDHESIDAFIAGDRSRLSPPRQTRIQNLINTAKVKKSLPLRFKDLSRPVCQGQDVQDQIDYDKSIEALTLISKAITSEQYVEDVLRLIVMVTAEVMNSSVCSLWLLDEKEKVLRLRATQSINKEYLKDRVLKLGEGIVGKVAMENQPYSIIDVLTDPFYKEKDLAQKMGLVSMLSMPMRVKDRVIGVINCYTSHPHEFTDLQMNVLTTVANQAAVAIENTELMVKTKVIQEELESRKIIERAKDLIMDRLQISGEEAYRWLQKRSMDSRKSMREVAEAVLLTMGH